MDDIELRRVDWRLVVEQEVRRDEREDRDDLDGVGVSVGIRDERREALDALGRWRAAKRLREPRFVERIEASVKLARGGGRARGEVVDASLARRLGDALGGDEPLLGGGLAEDRRGAVGVEAVLVAVVGR